MDSLFTAGSAGTNAFGTNSFTDQGGLVFTPSPLTEDQKRLLSEEENKVPSATETLATKPTEPDETEGDDRASPFNIVYADPQPIVQGVSSFSRYTNDPFNPWVGGDPLLNGRVSNVPGTAPKPSLSPYTSYVGEQVKAVNVLGRVMTREQIAGMTSGGTLLRALDKKASGERRGFLDSLAETSWSTFVPYLSSVADVGGNLFAAARAGNTFEKMQKGESVTNEELVTAQAFLSDSEWRSTNTVWGTVGDIATMMPALCAEFGVTSKVLQAGVKSLASVSPKIAEAAALKGAVKADIRHSIRGLSRAFSALGRTTATTAEREAAQATVRSLAPRLYERIVSVSDKKAGSALLFRWVGPDGTLTRTGRRRIFAATVRNAEAAEKALRGATTLEDKATRAVLTKVLAGNFDGAADDLITMGTGQGAKVSQVFTSAADAVRAAKATGDSVSAMNTIQAAFRGANEVAPVSGAFLRSASGYAREYLDLALNLGNRGFGRQYAMQMWRWAKDRLSRSLLEWGLDTEEILGNTWGQSLRNALNVATVEAPIKGAVMTAFGTAVRMPVGLVTSGRVLPMTDTELSMRASAFMSGDEDLMEKSMWYALGAQWAEMSSEVSGEAFSSVGRALLQSKIGKAAVGRWNAILDATKVDDRILTEGHKNGLLLRRILSSYLGDTVSNVKQTEVLRKLSIKRLLANAPEAAEEALKGKFTLDQIWADPIKKKVASELGRKYLSGQLVRAMFFFDNVAQRLSGTSFGHLFSPEGIRLMAKQVGWNGTVGEWMEERYGGFMSGFLGFDGRTKFEDKGQDLFSISRGWEEALPDSSEQARGELLAFMIPGISSIISARAQTALGTGSLSRMNLLAEKHRQLANHAQAVIDFQEEADVQALEARRAAEGLPNDSGDNGLDASALYVNGTTVAANVEHRGEAFAGTNIQNPVTREELVALEEEYRQAFLEYDQLLRDTHFNTKMGVTSKVLYKLIGLLNFGLTGNFSAVRFDPVLAAAQTYSGTRELLMRGARAVASARQKAIQEVLSDAGQEVKAAYDSAMASSHTNTSFADSRANAIKIVSQYQKEDLIPKLDARIEEYTRNVTRDLLRSSLVAEGALRVSMDGSIKDAAVKLASARLEKTRANLAAGAKEDTLTYFDPMGEKQTVTVNAGNIDEVEASMVKADQINLAHRYLSLAHNGNLKYNVARSLPGRRIASITLTLNNASDGNSDVAVYQHQLDSAIAAMTEMRDAGVAYVFESIDESIHTTLSQHGMPLDKDMLDKAARFDVERLDRMTEEELAASESFAAVVDMLKAMKMVVGSSPSAFRGAAREAVRLAKILSVRVSADNRFGRPRWIRDNGTTLTEATVSQRTDENGAPVTVAHFTRDGAPETQTFRGDNQVNEKGETLGQVLIGAGYEKSVAKVIFSPVSDVLFNDVLVGVWAMNRARNALLNSEAVKNLSLLDPNKASEPGNFRIFDSQERLNAVREVVDALSRDQESPRLTSITPNQEGAPLIDVDRATATTLRDELYTLEREANLALALVADTTTAFGNDNGAYRVHIGATSDARSIVIPFDPRMFSSAPAALVHELTMNRMFRRVGDYNVPFDQETRTAFSLDDIARTLRQTALNLVADRENSTEKDLNVKAKLREEAAMLQGLIDLSLTEDVADKRLLAAAITNIVFGYGNHARNTGNYIADQAAWGVLADAWVATPEGRRMYQSLCLFAADLFAPVPADADGAAHLQQLADFGEIMELCGAPDYDAWHVRLGVPYHDMQDPVFSEPRTTNPPSPTPQEVTTSEPEEEATRSVVNTVNRIIRAFNAAGVDTFSSALLAKHVRGANKGGTVLNEEDDSQENDSEETPEDPPSADPTAEDGKGVYDKTGSERTYFSELSPEAMVAVSTAVARAVPRLDNNGNPLNTDEIAQELLGPDYRGFGVTLSSADISLMGAINGLVRRMSDAQWVKDTEKRAAEKATWDVSFAAVPFEAVSRAVLTMVPAARKAKKEATQSGTTTSPTGTADVLEPLFAVEENEDNENMAPDSGDNVWEGHNNMIELNSLAESEALQFIFEGLYPQAKSNRATIARLFAQDLKTLLDSKHPSTLVKQLYDVIMHPRQDGSRYVESPLFRKQVANEDFSPKYADASAPGFVRLVAQTLGTMKPERTNLMLATFSQMVPLAGLEHVQERGKPSRFIDTVGRLTGAPYTLAAKVANELKNVSGAPFGPTGEVVTRMRKSRKAGTPFARMLAGQLRSHGLPTLAEAVEALAPLASTFGSPESDTATTVKRLFGFGSNGAVVHDYLITELRNLLAQEDLGLSRMTIALSVPGAGSSNAQVPTSPVGTLLNLYTGMFRQGRVTRDGATTELVKPALALSQQLFVDELVKSYVPEAQQQDARRFAEWSPDEPMFTHVVSSNTLATDIVDTMASVLERSRQGVGKLGPLDVPVSLEKQFIHFLTYTGDRSTMTTFRVPGRLYRKICEAAYGDELIPDENRMPWYANKEVYLRVSRYINQKMGLGQIEAKRTPVAASEQLATSLSYIQRKFDEDGNVISTKAVSPRVAIFVSDRVGGDDAENLYGNVFLGSANPTEFQLTALEAYGAGTTKVHFVSYNEGTQQHEMIKGNSILPNENRFTSNVTRNMSQMAGSLAKELGGGTNVLLTDFDGVKVGPLAYKGFTIRVRSPQYARWVTQNPAGLPEGQDPSAVPPEGVEVRVGKLGAILRDVVPEVRSAFPGISDEELSAVLSNMFLVSGPVFEGEKTLEDLLPGFSVTSVANNPDSPHTSDQHFVISYEAPNLRALRAASLYHDSRPEKHPMSRNYMNDVMTAARLVGGDYAEAADAIDLYADIASETFTSPYNKALLLNNDEELRRKLAISPKDFATRTEYDLSLNALLAKSVKPAPARVKAILVSPGAKYQGSGGATNGIWAGDDLFYTANSGNGQLGRMRANINDKRVRYGSFLAPISTVTVTVDKLRKKWGTVADEAWQGLLSLVEDPAATQEDVAMGLLSVMAASDGWTSDLTGLKASLLRLFTDCFGNPMSLKTHGQTLWGDAVGGENDRTIQALGRETGPQSYADGRALGAHSFYVGGTVIPFPRTPSGNFGPVFTALRLSTPVSTVGGDIASDSLVIPCPEAEWRLGADNDGDTAMLMLPFYRAGKRSRVAYGVGLTKELMGMLPAISEAVKSERFKLTGEVDENVSSFFVKDTDTGAVSLKANIRDRISALTVALFTDVSINRPRIMGKDWGVGTLNTKGLGLPDAFFDAQGRAITTDKIDLSDPYLEARIMDSARSASAARGTIVSAISALHQAVAHGFYTIEGPFKQLSSLEFARLAEGLDIIANTLFDDLKEQTASRLRLTQDTMDAFVGLYVRDFYNSPVPLSVEEAVGMFLRKVGSHGDVPFSGPIGTATAITVGFLTPKSELNEMVKKSFGATLASFRETADKITAEALRNDKALKDFTEELETRLQGTVLEELVRSPFAKNLLASASLSKDTEHRSMVIDLLEGQAIMARIHKFAAANNVYKASARSSRVITAAAKSLVVGGQAPKGGSYIGYVTDESVFVPLGRVPEGSDKWERTNATVKRMVGNGIYESAVQDLAQEVIESLKTDDNRYSFASKAGVRDAMLMVPNAISTESWVAKTVGNKENGPQLRDLLNATVSIGISTGLTEDGDEHWLYGVEALVRTAVKKMAETKAQRENTGESLGDLPDILSAFQLYRQPQYKNSASLLRMATLFSDVPPGLVTRVSSVLGAVLDGDVDDLWVTITPRDVNPVVDQLRADLGQEERERKLVPDSLLDVPFTVRDILALMIMYSAHTSRTKTIPDAAASSLIDLLPLRYRGEILNDGGEVAERIVQELREYSPGEGDEANPMSKGAETVIKKLPKRQGSITPYVPLLHMDQLSKVAPTVVPKKVPVIVAPSVIQAAKVAGISPPREAIVRPAPTPSITVAERAKIATAGLVDTGLLVPERDAGKAQVTHEFGTAENKVLLRVRAGSLFSDPQTNGFTFRGDLAFVDNATADALGLGKPKADTVNVPFVVTMVNSGLNGLNQNQWSAASFAYAIQLEKPLSQDALQAIREAEPETTLSDDRRMVIVELAARDGVVNLVESFRRVANAVMNNAATVEPVPDGASDTQVQTLQPSPEATDSLAAAKEQVKKYLAALAEGSSAFRRSAIAEAVSRAKNHRITYYPTYDRNTGMWGTNTVSFSDADHLSQLLSDPAYNPFEQFKRLPTDIVYSRTLNDLEATFGKSDDRIAFANYQVLHRARGEVAKQIESLTGYPLATLGVSPEQLNEAVGNVFLGFGLHYLNPNVVTKASTYGSGGRKSTPSLVNMTQGLLGAMLGRGANVAAIVGLFQKAHSAINEVLDSESIRAVMENGVLTGVTGTAAAYAQALKDSLYSITADDPLLSRHNATGLWQGIIRAESLLRQFRYGFVSDTNGVLPGGSEIYGVDEKGLSPFAQRQWDATKLAALQLLAKANVDPSQRNRISDYIANAVYANTRNKSLEDAEGYGTMREEFKGAMGKLKNAVDAFADYFYNMQAFLTYVRLTTGDYSGTTRFSWLVREHLPGGSFVINNVPVDGTALAALFKRQEADYAKEVKEYGNPLGDAALDDEDVNPVDGVIDGTSYSITEIDPVTAFKHFTLPSYGGYNLREDVMFTNGADVTARTMETSRFLSLMLGLNDEDGRIARLEQQTGVDQFAFRNAQFEHVGSNGERIAFFTPERNIVSGSNTMGALDKRDRLMVSLYGKAVAAHVLGGSNYLYTSIGDAARGHIGLSLGHRDFAKRVNGVAQLSGAGISAVMSWEEFRDYYGVEQVLARRKNRTIEADQESHSAFQYWLEGMYSVIPDEVLQQNGFGEGILRAIYEAWDAVRRETENPAAGIEYRSNNINDTKLRDMITTRALANLSAAGCLATSNIQRDGKNLHTLVIPVSLVQAAFDNSLAKSKLLAAGRTPEMLSMQGLKKIVAPVAEAVSKFRLANPRVFAGDSAAFTGMGSNFWLSSGHGVFGSAASIKEEWKGARIKALTHEEDRLASTYASVLSSRRNLPLFIVQSSSPAGKLYKLNVNRLGAGLRSMYVDTVPGGRKVGEKIEKWTETEIRALGFTPESTIADMAGQVYQKLMIDMYAKGLPSADAKYDMGEQEVFPPTKAAFVRSFELSDLPFSGDGPSRMGLNMDDAFRMEGALPADLNIATMVKEMGLAVASACAYTGTLHNMVTTLSMSGLPNYILVPKSEPEFGESFDDRMLGELALWYLKNFPKVAERVAYDSSMTGRRNCINIANAILEGPEYGETLRRQYEQLTDEVSKNDGVGSGSLKGILQIHCFVPGRNVNGKVRLDDTHSALSTFSGGEAKGYMMKLCHLRSGYVDRHRAMKVFDALHVFSKSMNVWGSLFFTIATRFESAIAAGGLVQTLFGQSEAGAKFLRSLQPGVVTDMINHSGSVMNKMMGGQSASDVGIGGSNFMGFADVMNMMDTNDPVLIQLRQLCESVGVTMSYPGEYASMIDQNREQHEKLLGRFSSYFGNLVSKLEGVEKENATRNMHAFLKGLSADQQERAFTYVMNATKMAIVGQICSRLRAKAMLEGRYFDPVRELRKVGNYINEEVGGINPLAHAFDTPRMRTIMDRLMFSWQWTMGSWSAGGGTVLTNAILGGDATTMESRSFYLGRWLRMYGFVMYGVHFMAQALINIFSKAFWLAAGDDPNDYEWLIANNERKARDSFDITPLLRMSAYVDEKLLGGWTAESKLGGNGKFLQALTSVIPMYTGDNTTGRRHYYMRFGKQGDEFFRWFHDPGNQFWGKLSQPAQKVLEEYFGHNSQGFDAPYVLAGQESLAERFNPVGGASFWNMATLFLPFSLNGLTNFNEAGALAAVGPTSRGVSKWSTTKELEKALRSYADNAGMVKGRARFNAARAKVQEILNDASRNGINPETLLMDTRSQVLPRYYKMLYAARPRTASGRGDEKAILKAGRALRALGATKKGAIQSMTNKYKQMNSSFKLDPGAAHLRQYIDELFDKDLGVYAGVRSTRSASKGGDARGTLNVDRLPKSIFGLPVKTHDEDYFRAVPEAAGFYDLDEEVAAKPRGKMPETIFGMPVLKGEETGYDERPAKRRTNAPKKVFGIPVVTEGFSWDERKRSKKEGSFLSDPRKALAIDDIPKTVFGLPVRYKNEQYFKDYPDVAGFYELGGLTSRNWGQGVKTIFGIPVEIKPDDDPDDDPTPPGGGRRVRSSAGKGSGEVEPRKSSEGLYIFPGYEDKRYQKHDATIRKVVDEFNSAPEKFLGLTTEEQGRQYRSLSPRGVDANLIKSWLIEESGGNGPRSTAAWDVDPAQVNVPGDWSDAKTDLGLVKSEVRNTGDAETNIRAAVIYLVRKGYGTAGVAQTSNPNSVYDGIQHALWRYTNSKTAEGYTNRIVARVLHPTAHIPIGKKSVIPAELDPGIKKLVVDPKSKNLRKKEPAKK